MKRLDRYRKEIVAIAVSIIVFCLLLFLESRLPFFQRFLPVKENKLVIIILNINLLLILLILFVISRTLIKVYIETKMGVWGSKLKTKLIFTLVFVSIIPAITLFLLASGFFKESMDRWFEEKIETTVESALELSRFYYEDLFQRYKNIAVIVASEIEKRGITNSHLGLRNYLESKAREVGVDYILFLPYEQNGEKIFSSSLSPEVNKVILETIKKGKEEKLQWAIPFRNGEIILSGAKMGKDGRIALVLVGDLVDLSGSERIKDMTSVYSNFKESRPFKKILKYGFLIPLTLVTLLVLFFSIWVGIKMANEIAVPIEKVKDGVSIIAKGKFDIDLEDRGKDEIGTLVRAFNDMAKELKKTKDEMEEKSRYLELIVENVGTGIISTDRMGSILLLNEAAKKILDLDEASKGKRLGEVLGEDLRRFMRRLLKEALKQGSTIKEINIPSKNGIIFLRTSLTTLKDETGRIRGFLVTFDDITQLLRAERLSTWRKVARRLTHEIKNPLTPITLSTERIRRKILPILKDEEKIILEEASSVILRSLEDIKGIVNDLTRLTHISQTKNLDDINRVIEDSISLYKGSNAVFSVEKGDIPPFLFDREGIRRVFVNLITNSLKAIGEKGGEIRISTKYDDEKGLCIVEFADTGKGIPKEDRMRIFDPYFTKDREGLGLGLAIVHSIILEHHGRIRVEDNFPRGAKFIMELPILKE